MMQLRGKDMYVTNIQRFCIDDGPGIRTTVFLSGCNMRCKWCHNPENLEKIMIRKEFCVDGTINIVRNSQNISVYDVLDVVKKDRKFYEKTFGGITISGGEPAMQVDEVRKLLVECKKLGINTVVETALNYNYEIIQQLSPYVDLFLVDCKAVTEDVHVRCTGVSNEKILDNIVRMSRDKINFYIRIPIIPDVNITYQEIRCIADFLKLIQVEHVELLPYHKMGIGKYKEWNMEYTLDYVEPPSNIFMKRCKDVLSKVCNNVMIQGERYE